MKDLSITRRVLPCLACFAAGLLAISMSCLAQDTQDAPAKEAAAQDAPAKEAARAKIYIREFRVQGAHQLKQIEVEKAVYPFMGPARTAEDVEQARAALEKAYKDKGFQTVSVEAPQQQGRGGIIYLQVNEAAVGRLRVVGSRYFSLKDIKRQAPSLAEGTVPNFNDVTRDIIALNQLPDRRVTPVLKPGVVPGTVDIDLQVKDSAPLHGSLELNNRYSPDTVPLRLNGALSYSNLWQLGHTLGAGFQIAPERTDDAKVFSAYYMARFPGWEGTTLTLQGVKQDSNISTLGGANSAGRGEILGLRWGQILPAGAGFYHSVSLGLDYKHFNQNVRFAGVEMITPVTYYPLSLGYGASWNGKGRETELNASLNMGLRDSGHNTQFDANRYQADRNFVYLRGDLSHTQDLPKDFEAYAKVQGQIADQPLVNSEQISGGGLGTVRGYIESVAMGDNAIFGTFELRSPSLLGWWSEKYINEWRVYGFVEGGAITLNQALPEQQGHFNLASIGFGSRLKLINHLNGSIDVGFPLINQSNSPDNPTVTFRAWTDF